MSFSELRRLIYYCLQGEKTIDGKYLLFVTNNRNIVSTYIDILESKFPPKPNYLPPKSIYDYENESEARIDAKRKDYEQKIANMKEILDVNANLLNDLEIKLSTYQKRINKPSSESPIYDRLVYWKVKMQARERSSFDSDEVNLISEIENINKEINRIRKKSNEIEDSIKLEENVLGVFIDTEKRWLSLKKTEDLEKQAKKEYKIKLKRHKNLKLPLLRIIETMRSDIANYASQEFSTQTLYWKLLPTGEIPFHQLKNYLQEISRFSKDEFDCEKIEKIISLKADTIYCGIDDFDGYLVFYFEKLEVAVLDCPKKGNAIYIFGEDWKTLSRLTKFELLNYHSEKTKRIIHRGDWFERLELFLETRKRNSHYDY